MIRELRLHSREVFILSIPTPFSPSRVGLSNLLQGCHKQSLQRSGSEMEVLPRQFEYNLYPDPVAHLVKKQKSSIDPTAEHES